MTVLKLKQSLKVLVKCYFIIMLKVIDILEFFAGAKMIMFDNYSNFWPSLKLRAYRLFCNSKG